MSPDHLSGIITQARRQEAWFLVGSGSTPEELVDFSQVSKALRGLRETTVLVEWSSTVVCVIITWGACETTECWALLQEVWGSPRMSTSEKFPGRLRWWAPTF